MWESPLGSPAALSFMDKGPVSMYIKSQWAVFFVFGSLIEC